MSVRQGCEGNCSLCLATSCRACDRLAVAAAATRGTRPLRARPKSFPPLTSPRSLSAGGVLAISSVDGGRPRQSREDTNDAALRIGSRPFVVDRPCRGGGAWHAA